MTQVNNAPEASAEDLAKMLSRAGVPQSVFFYVVLGMIAGARKLIFKAIAEGCPSEDMHCVDFTNAQAGTTLGVSVEREGFTFTSVDKQPLRAVGWGVPPGQTKLAVPEAGIEIRLPAAANRVVVRGAQYTGRPLEVRAYDDGDMVSQARAPDVQNVLHTLSVEAASIRRVVVSGGGNEGLLFSVCVPRPATPPPG
jgi:hypothetical protein